MPCEILQNWILTEHARLELQRRNITEFEISKVLSAPEQSEQVRPGRCVYQSRKTASGAIKAYLLRVFVDVDRDPAEVVTAYRTTKIAKYWR